MNRILIKLYVPTIEKIYDIWIPINKSVYNIEKLLIKGIKSFNNNYEPKEFPVLYNKVNAKIYDINAKIIDTDIRNGTELILI